MSAASAVCAALLAFPALGQTAQPVMSLDQFYARVQQVFSTGTQPADLQSLKDDFAKSKDSLCAGQSDPGCAQKASTLGDTIDGLQSVRDTIATLKTQPSVPAADFRNLDEKLKSLTIALAIPPQQAAALAATYMGEVAPSLQIQQDIVGNLNSAASTVNSKPGLDRFLGPINDIQSAVSVGQWGAARDLADHLFDHPTFGTGLMMHRSAALIGDMTAKLNPFGNYDDSLVQNIKTVQKDIAYAPPPQTAQQFTDRVQSFERGLDKFAVPIPLTVKESKSVDHGRALQQWGSMLINFAGVVPSLTAITMYLALGTVFVQGLVMIGLCPAAGSLLCGVGQFMQDRVRGEWSPSPVTPAAPAKPEAAPDQPEALS